MSAPTANVVKDANIIMLQIAALDIANACVHANVSINVLDGQNVTYVKELLKFWIQCAIAKDWKR